MKRFFIFVSLLGLFCLVQPVSADGISKFEVSADLSSNRTLHVNENIMYTFTDPSHGIYRSIPESYTRNGARYQLKIRILSVTRDEAPEPYKVTHENGNVVIRIGDTNTTVEGTHQYHLTYETDRAINDFAEGSELYWNVTGNGWPAPIAYARFLLIAPQAPDRTQCFTGYMGSGESSCTSKQDSVRPTVTEITTTRVLNPGEGFTVVVGFAPGVIQPLSRGQKISQFFQDNAWLFMPLLVFFVMFGIWWKKGKEPKGRGVIVAQYEEPQGLTPAVMTALMEQRIPHRAIVATILDLGRRGYLKVEFAGEKGKDIFFQKVKDADTKLATQEETILKALFVKGERVAPKELMGSFYRASSQAESEIYQYLKGAELFEKNPALVRSLWIILAVAFMMVTFWLFTANGILYWVASLLSAGIIIAFGWQMPRMTKEGAVLAEECEGFKQFLSVTEKARLDFTDAPERTPEQFARFLPAAVAFGVEEKWAKQFVDLTIPPPSYMSGPANMLTSLMVIDAIGRMNQVSSATMFAPPRSTAGAGGSGFSGGGSGGGFGGGGGGSW
ncbi:MAG: DUF2207 domain-containing protein [bacterium]|nr:DUF2207 domain-containing protein [bacterium]